MAIYDCFQYFNEDHMVDLRLNILDKNVDFFVISESTKTHQGKDKKLNYWLCGQAATKALRKKINNRVVECLSDKKDRYKRHIAICSVEGVNLNRWLVLNGWAVAYRKYSKDYIQAEAIARGQEVGIWSGDFILPWKWRRGKRLNQ